jgi:hypothetical protein
MADIVPEKATSKPRATDAKLLEAEDCMEQGGYFATRS